MLVPCNAFSQINQSSVKHILFHAILLNLFSNNISCRVMQEVAKEFVISVLKSQVKLVWGKVVDTAYSITGLSEWQ